MISRDDFVSEVARLELDCGGKNTSSFCHQRDKDEDGHYCTVTLMPCEPGDECKKEVAK